jgi:hypothetical protein
MFRQNLIDSSNLHYYVQKQVQFLSLLSMNKYVFLWFLNMLYSDFLFVFIRTTYIFKIFHLILSKVFYPLGLLSFTNQDYCLIRMISPQLPRISEGELYRIHFCFVSYTKRFRRVQGLILLPSLAYLECSIRKVRQSF